MNSHKCYYSECNNCNKGNKYVGKNHKCFMKKVKAKGGSTAKSIVRNLVKIMIQLKRKIGAIRAEPTQRNTYFMTSKLPKTHTVNLSIAQDFNGREYVHNNMEEFCKCFLNDKFKGYTLIAHNSKGYDCHFILKWLIDQGIKPYCIYNGAKIMFMEIRKLSIRFIDSLNFLQMPLKSFPKTFGMNELKKGYFHITSIRNATKTTQALCPIRNTIVTTK